MCSVVKEHLNVANHTKTSEKIINKKKASFLTS